jgi:hypothetical protein
VRYCVPLDRYNEFVTAAHHLREARLRTGAIRWGLFRNTADPESVEESFIMESWLDYLRSRERMTESDYGLLQDVRGLHKGDRLPSVTHQVYAKEITTPHA